MVSLNEEVEGALTAWKIREGVSSHSDFTPTAATLHVHSKQKTARRVKGPTEPFCVFCEGRGHWAQDCTAIPDVNGLIHKLKATNHCFLCLKRDHNSRTCSKRGRTQCSNCKGGPSHMFVEPPGIQYYPHRKHRQHPSVRNMFPLPISRI
jgi:hypothetical protein